MDPKAVLDLCRRAEQSGLKRNTVRRQLHRAISRLLRQEYGEAERDRIFAGVDYAGEDDTREVFITREEMSALFSAAERREWTELATIIRMALLTSADRGTLLRGRTSDGFRRGLLVRDVRIFQEVDDSYTGEVFLPDTKTKSRRRTVAFGDLLARELLLQVKGKGPEDPVFSMTYSDLDHQWQTVREEAGMPSLRFKDLRAQFSIYAQQAGIPTAVISRTMGHMHENMTAKYQRHQAAMSREQVASLEAGLFGRRSGAQTAA